MENLKHNIENYDKLFASWFKLLKETSAHDRGPRTMPEDSLNFLWLPVTFSSSDKFIE